MTPASRPAPGGDFIYAVNIGNTGTGNVTLTSLADDKYGDLNGRGTCSTGGTIVNAGSYSCTYTGTFIGVSGDSQVDTVRHPHR